MRGIDRDIGVIVNEIKREGMYGRTVFVITAARAMAPILTASPFAQLGSAVVAAGGEPVYITGDHAAFIGLQDPLQAQPVAQAMLNGHTRNVDAVYFKSQSGNAWSYQPQYLAPALPGRFQDACTYLLDTAAGAGAPDVVVVYRPGAGLQPAPSSGFTRSAGALGLQWEDQHIPLIIAGHGVYSGRDSSYPARLVDIAPTLEALLGLPTGSGDGVVLQDALYQSAGGEAAQQAEANRLTPLVTALRTRAGR
jgi:arylsulfatase A-like enzyme